MHKPRPEVPQAGARARRARVGAAPGAIAGALGLALALGPGCGGRGCGADGRDDGPAPRARDGRATDDEAQATTAAPGVAPPPTAAERAVRAAAAAAAGERAPGPAAPPAGATPEFMRALADGRAPLASVVDPERGVLFVVVLSDASGEDPRAGADGVIRRAERLCGAALQARLERMREDLARRVDVHGEEAAFRCARDTCRYAATMEFDVDGEVVLRTEGGRPPRLDRVVEIEGGMDETFYARERPWIDARLRALGDGRCEAADGGA